MKKLILLSLFVTTSVLAVPVIGVTNATKTTGALSLFVSTTGNDANNCLSLPKACLTLQGAYGKIPKPFIRHPVTINMGAGNFAGAFLTGFTFDSVDPATSAYIRILGTEGAVTPATGLSTGTVTSATVGSILNTTAGTLTVTGANWTVNDLRGSFVQITGGTGSGQIRAIASNTATVITIGGSFSPVPDGTSTFAIVSPTTKITSIVGSFFTPYSAADPTFGAGLIFAHNEGVLPNVFTGPILVERLWLDFADSLNIGVQQYGSATVNVRNCKFTQMGRAVQSQGVGPSGGSVRVYNSYSTTATVFVSLTTGSMATGYLEGNVINGGGTATALRVTALGWGVVTCAGNFWFNVLRGHLFSGHSQTSITGDTTDCNNTSSSTGLEADVGFPTYTSVSNSSFSNCTTGVKATGKPAYVILSGVTGSGNTTGTNALKGSSINIASNTTLTGATELSIDGASSALATMRGATPKHVKDTNYFTIIFE